MQSSDRFAVGLRRCQVFRSAFHARRRYHRALDRRGADVAVLSSAFPGPYLVALTLDSQPSIRVFNNLEPAFEGANPNVRPCLSFMPNHDSHMGFFSMEFEVWSIVLDQHRIEEALRPVP